MRDGEEGLILVTAGRWLLAHSHSFAGKVFESITKGCRVQNQSLRQNKNKKKKEEKRMPTEQQQAN